MQTAKPWAHLPKRHGNWRGVYNRLRMWALDGTTWERVCTALMAQPDTDEDLAWAFSGLGPLAIEHVVDEGGRILVRVRTPEDKTRMLLHEAKENPFKMPWSSSALSTSPR
ncbi:transposase [Streptomyces aureus]|uniref:Transposase n=1 Tax=Streptomyces aureus TaxID=193461 RepID=A0ABV4SQK2_9ACTN